MKTPDYKTLREELVTFAKNILNGKTEGDSAFESVLDLLPSGKATTLKQIVTALDASTTDGVDQTVGLFSGVDAYIHPSQATVTQSQITELLNDNAALDSNKKFEAWVNLFRCIGTGMLGTRHEAGVSFYHEFKLVSAILHAEAVNRENGRENQGFTLIKGDFPGVQNAIYTISSDGATKGVRGRSFFLQLLADCVVRRLLADLGNLPITNAIFVAGGHFLLLGPEGAEDIVQKAATEISGKLLRLFHTDISMIAAVESVTSAVFGDPDALSVAMKHLNAREGSLKAHALADIAQDDYEDVFGQFGGETNVVCTVCQRPPNDKEVDKANQDDHEKENGWICDECEIFEKLADDLAKIKNPILTFHQEETIEDPNYARKLNEITGWACVINDRPRLIEGSINLLLNDLRSVAGELDGFRLLAVHTPKKSKLDVEWLQKRYTQKELNAKRKDVRIGSIRDFDLLARLNTSDFARLGVLRMDVDYLGSVFKGKDEPPPEGRLNPYTLTRLMATSDSMSLFFEGYLSALCKKFEISKKRPDSLYMLYGGGDDLFIVGEWDLLPTFAQYIHDELSTFSHGQLTISAGLILIQPKEPFYRAADEAGEALQKAKNSRKGKNAITFLGTSLSWAQDGVWHIVRTQHDELIKIADVLNSDTVTRNVLRIFEQFQQDRLRLDEKTRKAWKIGNKNMRYGRYQWLTAYQFTRVADENPIAATEIKNIQKVLLRPETIDLSGPAARWAELERRAKSSTSKEN